VCTKIVPVPITLAKNGDAEMCASNRKKKVFRGSTRGFQLVHTRSFQVSWPWIVVFRLKSKAPMSSPQNPSSTRRSGLSCTHRASPAISRESKGHQPSATATGQRVAAGVKEQPACHGAAAWPGVTAVLLQEGHVRQESTGDAV
jgi:hypothetical protein